MKRVRPEQAAVESDQSELANLVNRQLDAHHDIRERLAKLEIRTEYLATKTDIANVKTDLANAKVWGIRGILGAVGAIGSILAALIVVLLRFWLLKP